MLNDLPRLSHLISQQAIKEAWLLSPSYMGRERAWEKVSDNQQSHDSYELSGNSSMVIWHDSTCLEFLCYTALSGN